MRTLRVSSGGRKLSPKVEMSGTTKMTQFNSGEDLEFEIK